jgi:DNA-binding MarR family transcriptional regulator
MATPPAPKSGILLGRELSAAVVLFHQAIADRLGLSTTEWKCIDILVRSGPTTAKQLAELAGLTTGGVTGVVDRLERAGYVERLANPGDRRSVIINLHAGRLAEVNARTGPIFGALGAAMYKLSTQYSPAELEVIERFIVGMTDVLRAQTAELRKAGRSG